MRLTLLTVAVMVAFAANSLLNRAALQGGLIDPMAFALLRLVAGAVVLVALSQLRRRDWRRFRPWGVAALAAYMLGFSAAYTALDAGAGALILFAGVQVTMFAGALAGGEAIPVRRWAGAALALGGLALMLWPGPGGVPITAGLLMAGAALGWGVFSLLGRGASDPLGTVAGSFLYAVPLAAMAWALWPQAVPMQNAGVALALISGGVTSGLGYAMWYALLPRLGAVRAALWQLTVPVIAVAGGVALLGEGVGLRLVLSCALVLGGVALGLGGVRRAG